MTDHKLGAPVSWTDYDQLPILFGNHLLVQHEPDGSMLTIGQATGPPLTGPPAIPQEHDRR